MPNTPPETSDSAYDRPSKSQVKREMLALLDLGKQLVDLSPDQLKQLPLSEKLYEAIRQAQRTTSREGLRRQIHYVGKLMRDAPADAIVEALTGVALTPADEEQDAVLDKTTQWISAAVENGQAGPLARAVNRSTGPELHGTWRPSSR